MMALEPPESLQGVVVVLHDTAISVEAVQGKIVVYDSEFFDLPGMQTLLRDGAAAVIAPASEQIYEHWTEFAGRPPGRTQVTGVERRPGLRVGLSIFAKPEAMAALRAMGEGQARLEGPRGPLRT